MLIHLESGVCKDDVNITHRFCNYVNYGNSRDVNYLLADDGRTLFVCQSCRKDFSHVSALFQHIESGSCDPHEDAVEDFEDFLRT
jgi:hypothetical protein